MPIFEDHRSIQKIVYIFHFIKDTGIVPQSLLKTGSVGNTSIRDLSKQIANKNRHIVLIVLMSNLFTKIVFFYYKIKVGQVMNGKFRHIPRELWKNDYPIVLVHGFSGSSPD